MVVGLGTSSTVGHTLDSIGDLLRHRVLSDIIGILTSKQTDVHAAALNISLSDLGTHSIVNLPINGADKVDPEPNLVKGRGGSLLHEKMIEADELPGQQWHVYSSQDYLISAGSLCLGSFAGSLWNILGSMRDCELLMEGITVSSLWLKRCAEVRFVMCATAKLWMWSYGDGGVLEENIVLCW